MARSGGLRLAWSFLREVHAFDLRHGTRTAELVRPCDFGLDKVPEGTVVYMASWTSIIEQQFNACRRVLGADFDRATFVDVGCGKGKVVLVWSAACRAAGSAQRVVGIDFSPVLLAHAAENLRIMQERGVRLIESDIGQVPASFFGASTILYLYNPFSVAVLSDLLTRLGSRVAAVIYCNPVHVETVAQLGFRAVYETIGWHPNQRSLLMLRDPASTDQLGSSTGAGE